MKCCLLVSATIAFGLVLGTREFGAAPAPSAPIDVTVSEGTSMSVAVSPAHQRAIRGLHAGVVAGRSGNRLCLDSGRRTLGVGGRRGRQSSAKDGECSCRDGRCTIVVTGRPSRVPRRGRRREPPRIGRPL